ncbi:MAG: aminopeptidase [Candidatus Nanoarchaeia archaeon]
MKPEQTVVNQCMQLKTDEKCLIVTDENKREITRRIYNASSEIALTEIIEIPVGAVNGEEPPAWCAQKMGQFDVVFLITTKSLSHTRARKKATEKNVRIASMPNVTEEMFERAINVDYGAMHRLTNRIAGLIDDAGEIKVTTGKGTNLTFNVSERISYGRDAGIYSAPGSFGNLPAGEAFVAPIEGSATGILVVDESVGGLGKVDEPISIKIENGMAVKIEGNKIAEELMKKLESINDKFAYNIAEFGIGTNASAQISGNTLEDEKVFGTCHVALGNNRGFGGVVDVPLHLDCVINEPDIFIDGRKIFEKGRCLLW